MKPIPALVTILLVSLLTARAEDVRQQPLKDLNGYFPFRPPEKLTDWEVRKEWVRRQILVATGLWPMPSKTPLNPVLHGKIDQGKYTIEKVYFESAPGFFVTGNLYRPKNPKGKVPAVMFAHGHRQDARLYQTPGETLRKEIADGAERFERSGHSTYQSQCRQLALMGCVVWQWDMLGDSDSIQFSRDLIHGFAKQRPEMNTVESWGLFSPQAEAHCQNAMGLQTLNSVRGLDFVLSLPEVDPERVAITGGSGGGTQTMILSAIDDRIKLSFPVVMVSTAMQGGCTCENASLLRVDTGNVEFAGLFAPKPQGMNTANDWTLEMATKGFPELQQLYALYGKKSNVFLLRGEHFPHNYNAVTRSAFYTFLNKHFALGWKSPVIETDFDPLPREQLTVWDGKHPAPKAADPDFERGLLKWLANDADRQLRSAAATAEGLEKVLRPALEVLIGRRFDQAGAVEWQPRDKQKQGEFVETTGTVVNRTYGEEVNLVWVEPKQPKRYAVVWLDDSGMAGLRDTGGTLKPAVVKLLEEGATVLGADLFLQGGEPVKRTREVAKSRDFAGYTLGFNHSLFAQRTHDVLSIVKLLCERKEGSSETQQRVAVVGWGSAGPIVLAARALAGEAIDGAAVDTNEFRFGKLLDWRDPLFVPGGAKYLDVPGLIALGAPHALWLAGESAKPEFVNAAYANAKPEAFTLFRCPVEQKEASVVQWLLR